MDPDYQAAQIKNLITKGVLYGITDLNFRFDTHLECAQELILAGVRLIQYRGKGLDLGQQKRELEVLVPWAQGRGCWVIVNDQIDLAFEVGANGVHLGQGDSSVSEARAKLGPNRVIGLSTHHLVQVKQAELSGADYIGVGPAYPTATKPLEPVVGLGFLQAAAQGSHLPQVAIGGISEARIPEVLGTGQTTVAIISDLLGSALLSEKVDRIHGQLSP